MKIGIKIWNLWNLCTRRKDVYETGEEELDQFYSPECNVFLFRCWVRIDVRDDANMEAETERKQLEDGYRCITYFWQGR